MKHYRPPRAHAVIADLYEHTNVRGERYLSGRSGQCMWIVTPIRDREPDGPDYALCIVETPYTRETGDARIVREAVEAEAGR